ncbi:cyclic nucleotide-binding domain-containing protein [Xanthobacteraceae bacterium A53D]
MTLDQDVVLLRGVPTFRSLTAEALRALAISAEQRRLKPGEILFRTGEHASGAFVVVSGRLEVYAERDGERQDGVEALAGAIIGETALILEGLRPATAAALEPSVVLRIPRSVFLRTLESFPDAAQDVRKAFAQRVSGLLGALDGVRDRLETPIRPPRRKG